MKTVFESECKTLICFVTIFPVRFVLLNLSLIPTAASAYLIEAVLKPNEKPAGWKSYLVNFTTWLGRIQLYIGGIFVKARISIITSSQVSWCLKILLRRKELRQIQKKPEF